MAIFNDTLGLILAGGLARRMGGGEKALIVIGGVPLLSHASARLSPQCAALALNANGAPDRFAQFGLPVVADDVPGFAGPLAGVLAGLDHARANGYAFVATLPVDTPFAPRDFVARLQEQRKAEGAAMAVAASGGRAHHAAALWPTSLATDVRRALIEEGERSVGRFCARYSIATVEWPIAPFDPFFNVNTPEHVARAEGVLREMSGECA